MIEGVDVGTGVGALVGSDKGVPVGRELLGFPVGGFVSPGLVGLAVIGASVGREDGCFVGLDEGLITGCLDGCVDGRILGCRDG